MKNSAALIVIIVAIATSVMASESKKQPVKLVIAKDTWNFGKIKPNKTVKHTFIIENRGNAPVTIETVIEGCSCMTAEIVDKMILPGKKTQLKVTYDAGSSAGEIKRTIQLVTDDTQEPVKTLHINGNIVE